MNINGMRAVFVGLLSLPFIVLVGSGQAWEKTDKIYFLDGKSIPPDGASWTISISAEDFKIVSYRQSNVRGAKRTAQSSSILRITHASSPKVWQNAVELRVSGSLEDAADQFKQSAGRSSPNWIKAYGLFEAGETYYQLRDWNSAIQAYQDLISQVQTSRFLPEAMLKVAECYFYAGDKERARANLKVVVNEASSKGFAERFVSLAEFWSIRVAEGSDWQKSISDYESLYNKVRSSSSRVANRCRNRIGTGFIALGRFEEAQEFFKSIVENASDDEVEAVVAASIGLGNCYSAQSGNQNKDFLREARRNYLRVVCSYYDDPGLTGMVPPELAAEALYKAGLCFEILREDDYRRRSRALYQEVISNFSGTEWAGKARKRR